MAVPELPDDDTPLWLSPWPFREPDWPPDETEPA